MLKIYWKRKHTFHRGWTNNDMFLGIRDLIKIIHLYDIAFFLPLIASKKVHISPNENTLYPFIDFCDLVCIMHFFCDEMMVLQVFARQSTRTTEIFTLYYTQGVSSKIATKERFVIILWPRNTHLVLLLLFSVSSLPPRKYLSQAFIQQWKDIYHKRRDIFISMCIIAWK